MPAMRTLLFLLPCSLWLGQPTSPPVPQSETPRVQTSLLLPDLDAHPRLELAWTTSAGERIKLEGVRDYAGDKNRTPLGENIEAFAAIGGTRLSKSAGHPDGLIVRAGFYKADPTAPFLRDIGEGGTIRVRFSGVRVNHPAAPRLESVVQHLKFSLVDLQECAIPDDAFEQFNLYSETELLNNRVTPGLDARPGVLGGAPDSTARTHVSVEDDASITLDVEFPYALLRHVLDPWQSEVPGTFIEPIHFHFEVELLPVDVLEAIESGEQVWPPPLRDMDESDQRPSSEQD